MGEYLIIVRIEPRESSYKESNYATLLNEFSKTMDCGEFQNLPVFGKLYQKIDIKI
jgi:hypothetical protein